MSEKTKKLLHDFLDECLNRGNLDAMDKYIAPEFVDHRFPDRRGIEGQRQGFAELRRAFPDIRDAVEDVIAEGDRIVLRFTMRGTHRGEFLGVPATGRQVTWSGINIARVANGKFVEIWGCADLLGLLQQLGAPAKA